jgi:hypothetical protein
VDGWLLSVVPKSGYKSPFAISPPPREGHLSRTGHIGGLINQFIWYWFPNLRLMLRVIETALDNSYCDRYDARTYVSSVPHQESSAIPWVWQDILLIIETVASCGYMEAGSYSASFFLLHFNQYNQFQPVCFHIDLPFKSWRCLWQNAGEFLGTQGFSPRREGRCHHSI